MSYGGGGREKGGIRSHWVSQPISGPIPLGDESNGFWSPLLASTDEFETFAGRFRTVSATAAHNHYSLLLTRTIRLRCLRCLDLAVPPNVLHHLLDRRECHLGAKTLRRVLSGELGYLRRLTELESR